MRTRMNGFPRLPRFSACLPLTAAVVLCIAPVASTPALGDWLVLVDGARIETDGAWTERGNTIVFEAANGDLMSIRSGEVDLEASRELTRRMAERAESPATEPEDVPARDSAFRLTDADVGHVHDEAYFAAVAEAEVAGAAQADETSAETPRLVDVTAWDRAETPSGDGLEVRATLANQGEDVATSLRVTVAIFDHEGEMIATAPGQLASNALSPGQSTEMTATFPGVFEFTSINFDVQQRALRTRPLEEAPEGGEELEGSPIEDTDTDEGS